MLKLADVIKKTSLSRNTIYREIEKGSFPKQIKMSPRRVAWREEDIEKWIEQRAANDFSYGENVDA